jgi:hypothetical protein
MREALSLPFFQSRTSMNRRTSRSDRNDREVRSAKEDRLEFQAEFYSYPQNSSARISSSAIPAPIKI